MGPTYIYVALLQRAGEHGPVGALCHTPIAYTYQVNQASKIFFNVLRRQPSHQVQCAIELCFRLHKNREGQMRASMREHVRWLACEQKSYTQASTATGRHSRTEMECSLPTRKHSTGINIQASWLCATLQLHLAALSDAASVAGACSNAQPVLLSSSAARQLRCRCTCAASEASHEEKVPSRHFHHDWMCLCVRTACRTGGEVGKQHTQATQSTQSSV